ncbi:MAG: N-methyl-L-tryptophan oxidase [Planctomycetota bacterium]
MTWDVIVIGCGGFGSACLAELSGRGLRVLGLDQFAPPHDRGSSHGETRIIRKAYFEHPDYVPLLHRAWDLWLDLSERSSERLLNRCDLVMTGGAGSVVVRGARESAVQHGLRIENLTATEGRARYPVLSIPESHEVVVEQTAGWLAVERCVATHLHQARSRGAELRTNVQVVELRGTRDSVEVETSAGRFSAGAAIVNCGPWTGRLLPDYAHLITVLRKTLFWYAATGNLQAAENFPMFLMDLPTGQFYGVPSASPTGMKVGEHSGGNEVADPGRVRRELSAADAEPVDGFVRGYLRGVQAGAVRGAVCQYSMSPDGHFLVDRHADWPVVVNAGFSGHGFKFTPVVAEAAADLVQLGRTALPIEFLSRRRFAAS